MHLLKVGTLVAITLRGNICSKSDVSNADARAIVREKNFEEKNNEQI